MGTSSKQEELKGLNDVQSSLRSYPRFFFPVLFFLSATIGPELALTHFCNVKQLLKVTDLTNIYLCELPVCM